MLRVLLALKKKGFAPDVIVAHPGWGETLYVRDVFPSAKVLHFCEWYYGTPDADLSFDPEFPPLSTTQCGSGHGRPSIHSIWSTAISVSALLTGNRAATPNPIVRASTWCMKV
jgi:hypothetical protein